LGEGAVAIDIGPDAHSQPECHGGGSAQICLVFGTSHSNGAEEADTKPLDSTATPDAIENAAVDTLPRVRFPAAAEVSEVSHVLSDLEQQRDGERVVVGRPLLTVGSLETTREGAAVGDPPSKPGEVLGTGDPVEARVRCDEAVPEARQVGHAVPQSRKVGVADQLVA
jgi:hypothetical protein